MQAVFQLCLFWGLMLTSFCVSVSFKLLPTYFHVTSLRHPCLASDLPHRGLPFSSLFSPELMPGLPGPLCSLLLLPTPAPTTPQLPRASPHPLSCMSWCPSPAIYCTSLCMNLLGAGWQEAWVKFMPKLWGPPARRDRPWSLNEVYSF